MKKLFLTAAVAALSMASPAAFAADDNHDHAGGGAPHAQAEHSAAPAHGAGPSHAAAPHSTDRTMGRSAPVERTQSVSRHDDRGIVKTTQSPATAWKNSTSGRDGHADHTNQSQIHNGRSNGGHGNVDVHSFNRRNVTAQHHYHAGSYRGPSGYSYRRWNYGEDLPSIYFSSNYWINDYSDYGLQYPPDGCVWVRYGDDALLIEQDSGEILEVVYGQFD